MNVARLRENLDAVRERMATAARSAGRLADAVRLVAVTKSVDCDAAGALVELGQLDLGENYPQELWRKAESPLTGGARWHLIGHVQTNKVKRTYPLVRWVHGVDSLRLLASLDEAAALQPEPGRVCLQVNCSGEASKHGWSPEQLLADADAIAAFARVPVAGLMTMAAPADDPNDARPAFARLRQLRDEMARRTGWPLPELSMGMSNDYEVAISEGATLVRVGTAIFEGVLQ